MDSRHGDCCVPLNVAHRGNSRLDNHFDIIWVITLMHTTNPHNAIIKGDFKNYIRRSVGEFGRKNAGPTRAQVCRKTGDLIAIYGGKLWILLNELVPRWFSSQ